MELPLFQALWQLRELPPEKVHVEATRLLESGLESPALIELAGAVTASSFAEIDPIARQAFSELGASDLSDNEARWIVAFNVARQIVAAEIEPFDGASRLWSLATDLRLPGQPINYFVYLAADYAEGPRSREEEERWFDAKIVETARELLVQRDAILASLPRPA